MNSTIAGNKHDFISINFSGNPYSIKIK